jgi:hypothetical protein
MAVPRADALVEGAQRARMRTALGARSSIVRLPAGLASAPAFQAAYTAGGRVSLPPLAA